MSKVQSKREKRERRHRRVRSRIRGTSEHPRLSVFRSHKHIWVQLIDDNSGKTLAAASDGEVKSKIKNQKSKLQIKNKREKTEITRVNIAGKVGELVAGKALKKKITQAVFDRGGYKYHGIVKAVAEGARKGGLRF